MKITLTFKQPDVLDALDDAIDNLEERKRIKCIARKWVEYDEYLSVEIDTEKETCTVLPAAR